MKNIRTLLLLVSVIFASKLCAKECITVNALFNVCNFTTVKEDSWKFKGEEIVNFILIDIISHFVPKKYWEIIQTKKTSVVFKSQEKAGLFVPWEEFHEVLSVDEIALVTDSDAVLILDRSILSGFALERVLSHEYFHLIHYYINKDETYWVREGLANQFAYMVTNRLDKNLLYMAEEAKYQDVKSKKGNDIMLGNFMLYFYYLYNECGEDELFWEIAEGNSSLKGAQSIDKILEQDGVLAKRHCSSFSNSVINFEIAKNHNRIVYNDTKFFLKSNFVRKKYTPLENADQLDKSTFEETVIKELKSLSNPLSMKLDPKFYNTAVKNCKSCSIFWSEKGYPYTIKTDVPSSTKGWDLIVLKVK